MKTAGIEIPLGTSFDNKGITDAEKAFEKFGTNVNSVLKHLGSDKSMKDLSDSIQTAFDAGIKGSISLTKKFSNTRMQVFNVMQDVEKLTDALKAQKKATDEVRGKASNIDSEEARLNMRKVMTDEERASFKRYEKAKKLSEEASKVYAYEKKLNQAAMDGVAIREKFVSYYRQEKALQANELKFKLAKDKLDKAQRKEMEDYFKQYNLKNVDDMYDSGKAYNANGGYTEIYKGYYSLLLKQNEEMDELEEKFPEASEKLEDLRLEFKEFMDTYSAELRKFDQSFGAKTFYERVQSIQSWMSQLNQRLETSADGTVRLTEQAAKEERNLGNLTKQRSAEYLKQRAEQEEVFANYADQTEEVKECVREEEKTNALLETKLQLVKALVKEMMAYGEAAEEANNTNSGISSSGISSSGISENYNFKDALKQVFSWQRIFTIIGRIVTSIGDKMQELGHKILGIIPSLGKLAISMMKAFGSGMVRGITTIGSTIKNIKTHFKDMLPSLKQVSRFLVKYIFGFRTMYFLVRKVRQAVGDGIKEIAKADKDVNKSISALKTALNQLKGQLGASFAPIIQPVANLLTQVINLATKATVQIGVFLATLTGKDTIKIATAKEVDYAKSLDKTSKSAGKAAKAIKAYLSPLDELNRMDDPNKDSGGGAGGGNGNNDDLGITYKDVKVDKFGISDFAKKLKEAWLNQDWEGVGKVISDKLAEVFGNIEDALSWEKIGDKIEKVTDIVSGIINGISKNKKMWEKLGKAIGTGINTAIKTVNKFIGKTDWKSIGSGIATALGNAIKKIDPVELAKFLEDKFTVVLDLLNGFMDKMKKDGTWTEIAKKVVKAINGVDWYGIAVKTFTFAGHLFGAIRDVFVGFISQSGFSELVDKIASGINESVAKLTPDDFKQAGIAFSGALTTLLGNIGSLLSKTSDARQKLLDGVKEFFKSINWSTVLSEAGDIAATLANGLVDIFSTIGELLNRKDANGVSLAQKIGVHIGNAIKKIDFIKLAEGFADFGEAILEGIVAAIIAADPAKKISEVIWGIFKSDSPLLKTLAMAGIWMSFVGAIISGIGKAIPLVLSANQATGGKLGSMIANWFSGGKAAATGGKVAAEKAAATGGKVAAEKAAVTTGGKAATGKAATTAGGKFAVTSGAAASTAAFAAVAAAAVMAGIAVDDYNQKQEAWAWGAEQVKNKNMSLVDVVKGGVASIPEAMGDKWGEAIEGWKWGIDQLGKKFKSGWDNIKGIWNTGIEGIKNYWKLGIDGIKNTWNTGIEGIKNYWKLGIDWIKEKFGSIKDKAGEVWDGIKGAFAHVGDWFKEKFTSAWENVKNVFSTGGQIFSGIKEGIERTFKTVVNKIIDGINLIIKKPFEKINDIITKLRGIDIFGLKPFKNFKNFGIPQIPKLAQGAVIPASKPFLAMLGDQKSGKNLEAPESLIRQIVREEAGGNNGKTTVVAKVGRRELFEIVLEEAKIRQQTTGRNPFEFT